MLVLALCVTFRLRAAVGGPVWTLNVDSIIICKNSPHKCGMQPNYCCTKTFILWAMSKTLFVISKCVECPNIDPPTYEYSQHLHSPEQLWRILQHRDKIKHQLHLRWCLLGMADRNWKGRIVSDRFQQGRLWTVIISNGYICMHQELATSNCT